ncbi:MAG: hemerythrin domain-containing protein [Actinomycetota bacterium]|nr:hemerythrin domain-containing protein [Actinomycetota bacterium]
MSDATEATSRPDDLITTVLSDHAEITDLFSQVESASGTDARRDAFGRLVRKLSVHETAEEEVVHPLLYRAPGGGPVAKARLEEESKSKELLSELDKMGVDHRQFDSTFARLRSEVLAHADREEREEHPRLAEAIDEDTLRRLAGVFRTAESMAPTRPHPKGPETALGNMIVGPFVGAVDRARDAIRNFRKR